MKIGIAVGVVIVILALVICLAPLKTVPYTVTVDYEDIETYYENEPYEVMETYYEDEPYQELQNVTEPLEYQLLGSGYGGYIKLDGSYICGPHKKIVNRAEVAGYFTFRCPFYFIDEDKYDDLRWQYPDGIPEEVRESEYGKLYLEETVYLRPGERGEAAWSVDELIGEECNEVRAFCLWEIVPEEITTEKMVTVYHQVERQRLVTEYRQVEKQRTVTKQRPETHYKKVTLLDYLLHY